MGAHAFSFTHEQISEVCCNCGIVFSMPADYQRVRREKRDTFYCPSGHPQHYLGETEAQKLQRELDRVKQDRDAQIRRASAAEKREQSQRGQVTRLRNRAKAGACPCCNRSFVQLARHMKSKHPDYGERP